MPFAAVLLYWVRDLEPVWRDVAWGLAAGVIAFLALAHAMAVVLIDQALLALLADDLSSSLVAVVGLAIGAGIAWALFEGPLIRMEGERILWAAVAFIGAHSFSDGLVLGLGFVGVAGPGYRIDAVATLATVVHRFAEGAIIVLPALAARWRAPMALGLLSAGLLTIPGAFVPPAVFSPSASTGALASLAVPLLFGAIEAGLGFVLLVRGFLPMAATTRGMRWFASSIVGFIGIAWVHFLVE
jgi:hypothetical protein